jgi:hypothetical protein
VLYAFLASLNAQVQARGYSAKYRGQPGKGLFEVGLVFGRAVRNLVQADWRTGGLADWRIGGWWGPERWSPGLESAPCPSSQWCLGCDNAKRWSVTPGRVGLTDGPAPARLMFQAAPGALGRLDCPSFSLGFPVLTSLTLTLTLNPSSDSSSSPWTSGFATRIKCP